MKPLHRHIRASRDIDETVTYYLEHASEGTANRFLDELDQALDHIARHPGTGSTRYARPGDAAPLRFWMLNRFPFAIFYIEQPGHIAVLRVLHQASDLPKHLT